MSRAHALFCWTLILIVWGLVVSALIAAGHAYSWWIPAAWITFAAVVMWYARMWLHTWSERAWGPDGDTPLWRYLLERVRARLRRVRVPRARARYRR